MFPKMLFISTMNVAHRHTLSASLCRLFILSSQHMCTKVPPSAAKPTIQSSIISEDTEDNNQSRMPGIPTQKLTLNQKRYMLLAFKHKTIAEIPDVLTINQIDRLYQRARITLNLLVALMVLIMCITAIGMGKQSAARGESQDKINFEWHRKNKEEHLAKEAAKLANSAPSQK